MIKLLNYLSNYSPVVPLITGLIILRKSSPAHLWLAFGLIVNSFMSDMISLISIELYGISYPVINIYYFIEIILLGFFYHKILFPKKLVIGTYILLIIIYIIYMSFDGLNSYSGYYYSFYCLVNIFICILFYYQIYNHGENISLENYPTFWIVTGLLIYFAGSLFTLVLSKVILNTPLPWSFVHFSNFTKNMLFAFAFMVVRKNIINAK